MREYRGESSEKRQTDLPLALADGSSGAQTLHRQLRRKGEEKEAQQKALDQKLIETAEQLHQLLKLLKPFRRGY